HAELHITTPRFSHPSAKRRPFNQNDGRPARPELARRSGRAPQRHHQQDHDRCRQQPPRRDALARQQPRQRQRRDDPHRDHPVVADDKVIPEQQKTFQRRHHRASNRAPVADAIARSCLRRSRATRPSETSVRKSRIPRMARSAPGQSIPVPSTLQKIPKVLSIRPTANFIVFSGTPLSGWCTSAPTIATSASARPAPSAASGMLPWVLPNVSTMKATSSPSRNTPLKAKVKAYQSIPA